MNRKRGLPEQRFRSITIRTRLDLLKRKKHPSRPLRADLGNYTSYPHLSTPPHHVQKKLRTPLTALCPKHPLTQDQVVDHVHCRVWVMQLSVPPPHPLPAIPQPHRNQLLHCLGVEVPDRALGAVPSRIGKIAPEKREEVVREAVGNGHLVE